MTRSLPSHIATCIPFTRVLLQAHPIPAGLNETVKQIFVDGGVSPAVTNHRSARWFDLVRILADLIHVPDNVDLQTRVN